MQGVTSLGFMELILFILSGALVGVAIGLTGVGGGSLMTPLLLLFNFPVPVAIGTDLLYAGFTKSGGVYFQHRKGNIRWRVMLLLTAGSIPVSLLLNFIIINDVFRANENYEALLTSILGVMLIITSLVIAFQDKIRRRMAENGVSHPQPDFEPPYYGYAQKHTIVITVIVGMLLGICVTLSSVGAGAFGAAALFLLYPKLKAVNIVATDIAHAVPLTLVAGMGYLYNGFVDFKLLLSLLCGSLPGIYLGTHFASRLADNIMRYILVVTLLGLGIYFSFFSS